MLKMLEKTWKEEEEAKKLQRPDIGQEIFQPSTQLTSSDSSSSYMDVSSYGRAKRSRASTDPATSERPSKLLKVIGSDSLRDHLPEVVGSHDRDDDNMIFLTAPTFKEQILEEAKHDNVIAVLPPTKSSAILLVQFLSWAVQQEKHRPGHSLTYPRTAFFVVDDISALETYSSLFESEIPDVSVGRSSAEMNTPSLEARSDLLMNDVVMVSSDLLLASLLHGALAITQLHTIVINDAENLKNQDSHISLPIVQVMNEFYRTTDSLSRPRIFALASSPPDRRSYFDSKMLKLEQTLDARVFGVTAEKRTEILALPDRPNELVVLYDTPQQTSETRLFKQLHSLDPDETAFCRYFRASHHAHEEVGACASDLVWRRALKDIDADLLPFDADFDGDGQGILPSDRMKVRMRDIIKNWAFTMPNLDPSSKGFNVSHKFLRLVQVLVTFRSYGEGFRGIIFVQRRAIALVLADLLRTADDRLDFLRPQAVVGGRQSAHPGYYQEMFHSFATGACNLLIGTKAIEDLDVPKASIVIRYDLFESQISHAYVRSRARGRESHLVHMVERGNDVHRRILSRITNLDTAMLDWTEALCNFPEGAVPPESLRETINPYHSDSEDEDGDGMSTECIKDPTTGGRIYLQDATTTLYRYAASTRSKGLHISYNQRLFEFQDIQNSFEFPRAYVCTIVLPGTPIDKISGDPASSKAQARRFACFKACRFLFEGGLLDFRLVPLPSGLRAQKDNIRNLPEKDWCVDAKTSGTRPYVRKRPDFWVNAIRENPTTLYPSVIFIKDAPEYSPIVILTRQPLPNLQSFRLFSSGVGIPVQFYKAAPLRMDEARLKDIHMYTIRICRTIMNKPLSCSLGNMLYFFLPLSSNWRPPNHLGLDVPDISDDVPWDLVSLAAEHWAVPINKDSTEQLELDLKDAIIQDRWIEFTRRYKVVKVRHDLTPLSKPADSQREAQHKNLFDFCKSKRKGLDSLENFEQPIIEVSKVPAILNHLNPTSKVPCNPSKSPAKCTDSPISLDMLLKSAKDLIPELCAKFTLPASILRTAMFLPSIMQRIDDLLIVKELNAKFFDHAVKEDLLHIAICTPSAAVEYDYERLELLGDAFLKYLSSVYAFVANPSLSEGSLHVARQKIISNKSLLQNATRVGLPAYIQSKAFAFKSWQPPYFQVHIPPKTQKDVESKAMSDNIDTYNNGESSVLDADLEHSQALNEFSNEVEDITSDSVSLEPGELVETISDNVADSPISPTAALSGDEQPQPAPETKGLVSKKKQKGRRKKTGSDKRTVQWLGDKAIADVAEAIIGAAYISGGREAALQVTKALTIPLSNVDRWSDFGRKVLTPSPDATAKLRAGSIFAIENIIGHKFNRPHLLGQAMTHSSIQGYESTSYERLEFIGDAILDFMVIRHIFDRDQKLSPGALTMLKGAMVSNSALAAVCVWSGLHEFLLFESSQLSTSIQGYAIELKDRQEKEYILAEREGRSAGQYWLDLEPPKALSDLVESIIGAIYISDNFSPIGAESLFDRVLKPFYDKHITLNTLSHHPTKILFELLQAQGCQQFGIVKDRNEGLTCCHVVVHEVILASGEDTTHVFAARLAALFALDALEGDADFMTRTCDCRTHIVHKKVRKKSAFEQALENALKSGETDANLDSRDDEMEVETLEEHRDDLVEDSQSRSEVD